MSGVFAVIVFGLATRLPSRVSINAFLVASIISAALAFTTILFFPSIGVHQPFEEPTIVGSWRAMFYTKNSLGAVSAIFSIIALFTMLSKRINASRYLALLSAVLNFSLLIGSESRTSIGFFAIGALLILLILGLQSRSGSRRFLSLLLSVFLISILISGLLWVTFLVEFDGSIFNNRGQIWMVVWSIFESAPYFGVGYGSIFGNSDEAAIFSMPVEVWIHSLTQAHSAYLAALASTGITGFSLLHVILVSGFVTVLSLRGSKNSYLVPLCCSVMTFSILNGLTEEGLGDGARFTWVTFMWFYGIAHLAMKESLDA